MSSHLEKDAPREASILGFFQRQFMSAKPLDASVKLTDWVAIVTGSNGGLGFESARQLCQLGVARLIMAVRSQAKGDAAAEKIRKEFPGTTVEVWLLDMNSYDSVTAFASRCEGLSRIDVVLLNAGIQQSAYEKNPTTGHEIDLQVNYLSTALLTILLLPVLRAKRAPGAPTPVLSVVASDTAFWAGLKDPAGPILSAFDDPANFSLFSQYSGTKLLLMMFIAVLATKVKPSDVVVNASNPGLTKGTSLAMQSGLPATILGAFMSPIARSVESGAATLIDALLVHGDKSHGSYVSDWAIKPYPKLFYTEDGQKAMETLWQETTKELEFANVSGILGRL